MMKSLIYIFLFGKDETINTCKQSFPTRIIKEDMRWNILKNLPHFLLQELFLQLQIQ